MNRTPMLDALKQSWMHRPAPADGDLLGRIGTLQKCEDDRAALILEEILMRSATAAFDELHRNLLADPPADDPEHAYHTKH
jgi:hypothetical protein